MAITMMSALASVAVLLSPAAIVPAAVPAADAACTWRLSTVRLYEELAGQSDDRSVRLRELLAASGVADPDFLPASCRSGPGGRDNTGTTQPSNGNGSGSSQSNNAGAAQPGDTASGGGTPSTGAGNGSGSGAGTSGTGGTGGAGGSGNCPTTAAATLGWGTPNRTDDFTDQSSASNWGIYDGAGHAGNGRRSPSQVSIADGLLTLTGDEQGNSAGMAWNPGQMHGRWEGCVQSPPGADSLHALLLLWPDAENWPVGGEVDFMEISDSSRQSVDGFLHYGADNQQEVANTKIDATQWHAWAVEWTPQHIAYYVDGKQWFETTDTSHLPPGPMHLTIQLDYFGGNASGGAKQHVDWVHQYPATGSGGASASGTGTGASGGNGQGGQNSGGAGDQAGNGQSGGRAQEPGSSDTSSDG